MNAQGKATNRLGRRSFIARAGGLAGVGAAGLLFPWLSDLRAQSAAPNKKLLLLYSPHGTIWDNWRPTGGETGFTLPRILEPLEPHRDQVAIVDGLALSNPVDYRIPHSMDMPAVFTGSPAAQPGPFSHGGHEGQSFGWNLGVSIDQAIAQEINPLTPHRSVELGVECGDSRPANRMIYTGPSQPRAPIQQPLQAWNQLFSDATAPERDEDADRRRAVLDVVKDDLRSVRPQLSAADRARIDAHETALNELQGTLAPFVGDCTLPEAPSNQGLEEDIDLQLDLIVAALACGQTRFASMQITKGDNDGALYPWVGLDAAGHHSLSHDSDGAASATRTELYRWYTQRFSRLLDRMASIPDGDGTSLLDNTLIIWGSEIGVGWTHDISNIPFVVAGGTAHGVRGGRHLTPTGVHNRLLVSAAHYMGLTEWESFGSGDNAAGGVPGLLA